LLAAALLLLLFLLAVDDDMHDDDEDDHMSPQITENNGKGRGWGRSLQLAVPWRRQLDDFYTNGSALTIELRKHTD
jgi:hypothetical protein